MKKEPAAVQKMRDELARRIRYWREQLQLTQAAFAVKAEISRSALSEWEGAKKTPSLEMLAHLANCCGVSLAIYLTAEIPKKRAA